MNFNSAQSQFKGLVNFVFVCVGRVRDGSLDFTLPIGLQHGKSKISEKLT